jgi:phosphonate transport system substrate-binding protein
MIRETLAILAAAVCLAGAAHADTYKLAVTDVEGLERLQTDWGPFKAQLEKATGDTFQFFPVSSRTAAAEALKAKRVDFVITGPAEYVVINKLTDAKAIIASAVRTISAPSSSWPIPASPRRWS